MDGSKTAYRSVKLLKIPGIAISAAVCGLVSFQSVGAQQEPRSRDPFGRTNYVPPEIAAEMLTYYPAKAKADGVEGSADLHCVPRDGAYPKCKLLAESPKGHQFGEAAIALVGKKGQKPPEHAFPKLEGCFKPFDIRIKFSLNPAEVRQETSGPNPLVQLPKMLVPPTAGDVARAYPDAALRGNIGGRAVIRCDVSKKGRLNACEVAEETPAGHDFGKAALSLTPKMLFSPATVDGVPCVGSVRLPIRFTPPF